MSDTSVRVPYPTSQEFSEMWYEEMAQKTEPELQNENLRLLHAVVGLTTEVGELADPIKKKVFYGRELTDETVENLEEEIGDILWYLAIICNHFGFFFQDIMWKNINKLAKRYPDQKFTSEDALARADKSGEGESSNG